MARSNGLSFGAKVPICPLLLRKGMIHLGVEDACDVLVSEAEELEEQD